MDAPVIDRIEASGWSWTVTRTRAHSTCEAYVHVPFGDDSIRSRCFSAEGRTPELALINAEAKAIHAGLPELEAA